jgi:hypothetical protein
MAVGTAPAVVGGYAGSYSKHRAAKRKAEAELFAACEVELEHACNGGEFLIAGLRDYQKRPLCAKCDAGTAFISDGKGGGVETCSACGSGDVVAKLNEGDKKQFCDLLTQVKDAETEKGISESDEFTTAQMRAETDFNCRAGDQGACRSAASFRASEQLAQTEAQTEAMQSQAAALWSQTAALRQANQQRWEASQGLPVLP